MSKLVIAEKPSVGISIAKVIGANTRKDGYMEGNGYIVSWCIGHLIQMANPDVYDEKYKKWNLLDLPIIPGEYKYEVSKSTKKQFSVLKKLLNDKNIELVINACDAGREGESIFRLVYNQANCKKKMQRLWLSSMEDSAIKEGFNNLRDGKLYDNLFESAQARAIADWLVGMNISRLYSALHNKNYSVGRVQTPTLNMIVNRDYKIKNFQKEKYYTIEYNVGDFILSTDRIDNLEIARKILENNNNNQIKVTSVVKEEKVTNPPLPFDLTTLQRECNKYFGFSASQVLEYSQSLYEKKIITYPRTDSRCLTDDMVTNTINNILGKNDFDTKRIKVVFNSKKVTDHHAIIPTKILSEDEISNLSQSECDVYKLILNKFHASVGYPLIENITKILCSYELDGNNYDFKVSGKVIANKGYSQYLSEYAKENEDVMLPDVAEGDLLEIKNKELKEKYTQPPKHYTEDSLLKAMEIAGNDLLEKGVEVERKGIGTPATRASIIENLISKGFVERQKKNLIATTKGVELIDVVANNFKSPKMTAEWEMKLSDVSNGKLDKNVFLKEVESDIVNTIGLYKKNN